MPSFDDEEMSNYSGNETFEQVVAARLSRRGFLSGGLASAAVASMGGVGALLTAVPASAETGRGPAAGLPGHPASRPPTRSSCPTATPPRC